MTIKFDNFVIMMAKGKGEDIIPHAAIRFLTGKKGKEKRFEHTFTDKESIEILETLRPHFDEFVKAGVIKLVEDFEDNIKGLKGDIK